MEINLKDMKKYQVLSSDGHIIGKISDVVLKDKWCVCGLSIDIDKAKIDALGKKKPFLSTLVQNIGVEHVKALTDKVVVHESIQQLGAALFNDPKTSMGSRIIKMEITGAKGVKIGIVEDLVIDTDNWRNPSIKIKLNREILDQIKIEKPMITSPRVILSFKYVVNIADVVMLNTDVKALGEILESHSIKKAK